MADRFEIPLDIEGVKIERVDFTPQGEILIMVTSMVEGTRCHRCGQEIKDSYGYGRELKLRHLPILGKPTYLCIRPKRYICRSCSDHPTTTQQLAWYDLRSPKAYEAHVLLVLVNSTVYDVSRKEGLGGEVVMESLSVMLAGKWTGKNGMNCRSSGLTRSPLERDIEIL